MCVRNRAIETRGQDLVVSHTWTHTHTHGEGRATVLLVATWEMEALVSNSHKLSGVLIITSAITLPLSPPTTHSEYKVRDLILSC